MKITNNLFVSITVFFFLGVSAFARAVEFYGSDTPIDERAPRAEGVPEVPQHSRLNHK